MHSDPVHFTGSEILEMAVRIEENGVRFYTDAGKSAKSREVKDLFLQLAEEEKKHIKVFTGFKSLLPPDESLEGYDPFTGEASLYLNALADTEVFTRPGGGKDLSRKVKDEKDALGFAIQMEKDSLLFYYELQKMVRDKDRAVLDSLVEQEKEHFRKLTALQKMLFPQ